MSTQTPPHWDLTNVYPSLSSKEYAEDFETLKMRINALENLLSESCCES